MERDLAAKDSHESFHSTRSQPEAPMANPASFQVVSDLHTAALQAAGLPVFDIETFLNDPRNQVSPEVKSPPPKKQRTNHANSSSLSAPEQIGSPKTTHNVPALHHICQERGLLVDYDIDGDQLAGFGGTVTVGGQTIMSDQRWQNKKEAKEGLAELAVPVVRGMGTKHKDKALPLSPKENRPPERNWVGMLIGELITFFLPDKSPLPFTTCSLFPSTAHQLTSPEYYNAVDPTHSTPGSIYTEYALGLSFACTCSIPSTDGSSMPLVLGSPTTPFSNKKAARNNAAKAAVQHLISIGELNADGSCKAKKKFKLGAGPTVKVEAKGIEVKKDASYANRVSSSDTYAFGLSTLKICLFPIKQADSHQVNDLAPLLSLTTPVYRFTPASAAAPNMFSGAAYFSGDALHYPSLKGEVGEVRNVYGKKNAKEECARGVWEALKGVAKERGVEFEETEV
ncbi:MAG: hypothetical protein Q9204_000125 [Flavoplaca sp. TL-2023a]